MNWWNEVAHWHIFGHLVVRSIWLPRWLHHLFVLSLSEEDRDRFVANRGKFQLRRYLDCFVQTYLLWWRRCVVDILHRLLLLIQFRTTFLFENRLDYAALSTQDFTANCVRLSVCVHSSYSVAFHLERLVTSVTTALLIAMSLLLLGEYSGKGKQLMWVSDNGRWITWNRCWGRIHWRFY